MTAKLLEKLPGGLGLYRLDFSQKINPGQWLINADNVYPVFSCDDESVQIITTLNSDLPNQFSIAGKSLNIPDEESKLLFIAEDDGIVCLLFLINDLLKNWGLTKLSKRMQPLLLGSKTTFPFKPVPSKFLISEMPISTIANAQLLEDLGLPGRLATETEAAGCFPGSVIQLAEQLKNDKYFEQTSTLVALGSVNFIQAIKKLFAEVNNKQFLVQIGS